MRFYFVIILTFLSVSLFAQELAPPKVIQFSGLILTDVNDKLEPVPYTTIMVKGTNRGTYSNIEGFFSIAVETGDVLSFSAIGFRNIEKIVPDTLTDSRYSVVQLMVRDTINLPEIVIFPWPSREHFAIEFLAMDVTNEMEERLKKNLAEEMLAKVSEVTPMDGNENSDYYMRQQARSFYHYGQTPPMNIFNLFAWAEFIKAWKAGKFKRKNKKED